MCDGRRGLVRALIAATAILATAGSGTARSASLFDPALRFRVIRTDHFRIYFHNRTERLAARLAGIAEDVWLKLERPLGVRPPRLTHVVIADQTELPNAYATPLPYDTIVIYPTWPIGAEFDVDDWLRLVFTHEFTHIVHLDRSESWARVVRRVFGRAGYAFPNLFLPTWQIEGLATYQESALTGEGRLHAGEFRALVDEAARRRTLEPLDRVNGGLTDWPGGQTPYAYGSAFHEYLADRFGAETLATLAERTARRVPYTASRVFPSIFGQSLGDLWRDFEAARAASVPQGGTDAGIRRVTHDGFVAAGPRFDRTCETCAASIVYTRRTPHEFPSIERIGLEGGEPKRIATRYFGSTTGIGRDALYFDQLEVHRSVALFGDLYRVSRETGRVTRLTTEERLHDPDLSPVGDTIAAVQENAGRRDLVLVRLKADTTYQSLLSDPDTQFNAPRWSPDGRTIAVERHRLGFDPEIITVDPATRAVRVIAARAGSRIVMPAWRPDGRAVVAAVAPDDEPFNLVEFALDEPHDERQLTRTGSGATWPDVSPDGKTLAFVGYSVDGYDVYTMPYPGPPEGGHYDPRSGASAGGQRSPGRGRQEEPAPLPESTPYSPLPTLKPTSWSPFFVSDRNQFRVGAAITGVDVLGYHGYAVSATWLVSGPDEVVLGNRATPDWSLSYVYDRWRVTPFVAAESATTFFAGPPTAAGTPSASTRRELDVEAGAVVPFIRARWSQSALASIARTTDDYTLASGTQTRNRTAVRAAWRAVTARQYGYSVSLEHGIAAGTTMELVRSGLGASGDASIVTADMRAFLPGLAQHHVVGLRAAGGASGGDATVGRTFVLGGPGPDTLVADFGSGAVSVLRGFPANSFAGSHVALLNAEYRWPIARPQRGAGTWPFFLHTLHAAAFVDAGHAWTTPRTFEIAAIKTSFGAEFSANIVAGFFVPATVTAGVARGHDGSGTRPPATTVYLRVGKSF